MGNLEQDLMQNVYPGRGIVIGRSADGKNAVIAYFIMGRSVNSRNRIFVEDGEGIRTQAFDPSKVEDPSLIIYAPVRVYGDRTIVTNGDQTDTVYDGLEKGLTFEQSLRERMFEPDAPNYTPRISGLVHVSDGCFDYQMSILKSDQGDPDCCVRYTFEYTAPKPGQGRFIHTYQGDGNPLPSYEGEPFAVKFDEEFTADVETFAQRIWNALNADNRVSLFCRFIEIESGKTQTCIINCHE
ncbi:MAG: IMP cyclohydrolase [Lachnospiraceae bacterium]|nr:IMP cyclohydrolase [Lachnospiraceae bacterium]